LRLVSPARYAPVIRVFIARHASGDYVASFLKAYTIKSSLSVHDLMVFKFFACLAQEKIMNFLLASLKTLAY
jgi:hypothetical protein